jgi:hypothetical protein
MMVDVGTEATTSRSTIPANTLGVVYDGQIVEEILLMYSIRIPASGRLARSTASK